MITLTGGGVTITVTKEDAAFYMRLGYSPVNHEKINHEKHEIHEPLGKLGTVQGQVVKNEVQGQVPVVNHERHEPLDKLGAMQGQVQGEGEGQVPVVVPTVKRKKK